MASEVDREAFMRLMGLTATDVADPDSRPARASTRAAAPKLSPAGTTSQQMYRHTVGSPVTSSTGGLSPSTSLPGDADGILNFTTSNTTMSLSGRDGTGFSRTTALAGDRNSGGSTRQSARTVSFDAPLPRGNAAASPTPRHSTSASETLKEAGNRAFESGLFEEAIRHYSAAIVALTQAEAATTGGGAGRAVEKELLAALHSNRSAAYLQAARQWTNAEEAFGRALCDADRAVALRPSWFKGYSRQGDAYFKLRRYGTAAEAYEMALQLDPRNTTLSNALDETRLRAKQAAREEMEMRRTMRSTGNSHMSSTRSTGTGFEPHLSCSASASPHTTPMSMYGEAAKTTSREGHRSSGQTQQLWADLKHEVEVTAHEPTGDAYRLQQLERFRKRGTTIEKRPVDPHVSGRETEKTERGVDSSRVVRDADFAGQRSAVPPKENALPSSRIPAGRPAELSPGSFVSSTAPTPPPRRSSYDSPTAGGIPAAMANFNGPVTSARDVPYEFSSAAASAYQQKLLEAFRQRKGKQQ